MGVNDRRRAAASLANFPQFPGWNSNLRDAADPWTGDPAVYQVADQLFKQKAATRVIGCIR